MKISRLYATTLAVFASVMMLMGGTAPDAQPPKIVDPVSTPGTLDDGLSQATLSSGFDLSWYTIDGGGGTSSGGGFTLSGTIGQPDAGSMSNAQFEIAGGFWTGAVLGDEPPTCLGDINGDNVVNVSDLLLLLGAWGTCPTPDNCPGDFNGDGVVNVADLLIMLSAWGACP
jgi:hypothetical protein